MRAIAAGLAAGAMAISAPAGAEVLESGAGGFSSAGTVSAAGFSTEDLWYALVEPAGWWSGEHTWSGDARNLRLDPKAGGCFCEDMEQGGSVEHMRVIYAVPGQMLRMAGALGPLQGEGLAGTLTIDLANAPGGSELSWTYVVGGHARFPLSEVAAPVDMVLSEQFHRLVRQLEDPAAR